MKVKSTNYLQNKNNSKYLFKLKTKNYTHTSLVNVKVTIN